MRARRSRTGSAFSRPPARTPCCSASTSSRRRAASASASTVVTTPSARPTGFGARRCSRPSSRSRRRGWMSRSANTPSRASSGATTRPSRSIATPTPWSPSAAGPVRCASWPRCAWTSGQRRRTTAGTASGSTGAWPARRPSSSVSATTPLRWMRARTTRRSGGCPEGWARPSYASCAGPRTRHGDCGVPSTSSPGGPGSTPSPRPRPAAPTCRWSCTVATGMPKAGSTGTRRQPTTAPPRRRQGWTAR